MKAVWIGIVAAAVVGASPGGAAAQSGPVAPWAGPTSGRAFVGDGVLEWRYVELPRYGAQPPRRRYSPYAYRYGEYGGYGRRSYDGYRSGGFSDPRGRAVLDGPLSFRFDERRGVWVAERAGRQ